MSDEGPPTRPPASSGFDARALFDSALAGPLDARVRDLVIAEAQGNPLALLELPRGLPPTELAGGFGLPRSAPLAGKIERCFRQQLAALPVPTQRLLQLAAADPTGDLVLVRRAAGRLGLPVQAAYDWTISPARGPARASGSRHGPRDPSHRGSRPPSPGT